MLNNKFRKKYKIYIHVYMFMFICFQAWCAFCSNNWIELRYIRCWNIPRSSIWEHSPRINSPWIILMTASHSYINTRGKMYDSSVLVWSNEWLTGSHGDWLQAPFVNNLAPWPPTNRWTYCCSQMTLITTTLGYIKWICRCFCYGHFKSVNLTCVWMGLPFTCIHLVGTHVNNETWILSLTGRDM